MSSPLTGVVAAGFTKIGTGNLTLSAASPLFDGQFIVNAGTLTLAPTGSLPQVTTVTVNTGATLAGTGSVGGSVKVAAGGTFAPGINGAGQFTVGSNLTLASGSTEVMELGGATAGSGYDQELVFVGMTLGGNLTVNLINGFLPTIGEKFFLFDLTGQAAATGTFANATGAGQTRSLTDSAGNTYLINYADRDPADASNALFNDVSLTFQGVVPEPSTWALSARSAAALLVHMARRSVPADSLNVRAGITNQLDPRKTFIKCPLLLRQFSSSCAGAFAFPPPRCSCARALSLVRGLRAGKSSGSVPTSPAVSTCSCKAAWT